MSTYDRYETFLYLLDHYGKADLPNLDAIFINWVSSLRAKNDEHALICWVFCRFLRCRLWGQWNPRSH